jgi:hypothetical protein
MIGRIVKGRGFRGLLAYLARRPGAEIVGGNMAGSTARELAQEFALVRRLRPGLGRAVFHLPLRLPPEESLSREEWRHVAERVLAGLGFAGSPHVLWRHPHDGGGEHWHLVASRVGYGGEVVAESFDYARTMRLLRRIEADYGLRPVAWPGRRHRGEWDLRRGAAAGGPEAAARQPAAEQPEAQRPEARQPAAQPERVARRSALGRLLGAGPVPRAPSMRQRLQAAVAAAAATARSIQELVGELERQEVRVRARVTAAGRVTGIRFRLGLRSYAGSALGPSFSWPGLLRHYRLGFAPRRDLAALVAAGGRFGSAPSRAAARERGAAPSDGVPAAGGARLAAAGARPAPRRAARRQLAPPRTAVREVAGARLVAREAARRKPALPGLAPLRRVPRQLAAVPPAPRGLGVARPAARGLAGAQPAPRRFAALRPASRGLAAPRLTPSLPSPPRPRWRGPAVVAPPLPEAVMSVPESPSPAATARDAGAAGAAPDADAADARDTGVAATDADAAGAGAAEQVRRQLAALASPRYDLLVVDAATRTPRHQFEVWTAEQVLAAVPWLAGENARGGEVLVRPAAPLGFTHLAGVPEQALAPARSAGFEPAAVLRCADGSHEVWLRAGAEPATPVRPAVERALARRFRTTAPAAAAGWGHLAGFTSPLARRAADLPEAPRLRLAEAAGAEYRAAAGLAARAARRVAERQVQARVEREVAALGGAAGAAPPAAGAALPVGSRAALRGEFVAALRAIDAEAARRGLAESPPAPEEIEPLAREVAEARLRYAAMHDAFLDPVAADPLARAAAEGRVAGSFRALRAAEDLLAERLGVEVLPADLAHATLAELARRQAAVLRAEARSAALELDPGSAAADRREAALAARQLRSERAAYARAQGCAPAPAGAGLEKVHAAPALLGQEPERLLPSPAPVRALPVTVVEVKRAGPAADPPSRGAAGEGAARPDLAAGVTPEPRRAPVRDPWAELAQHRAGRPAAVREPGMDGRGIEDERAPRAEPRVLAEPRAPAEPWAPAESRALAAPRQEVLFRPPATLASDDVLLLGHRKAELELRALEELAAGGARGAGLAAAGRGTGLAPHGAAEREAGLADAARGTPERVASLAGAARGAAEREAGVAGAARGGADRGAGVAAAAQPAQGLAWRLKVAFELALEAREADLARDLRGLGRLHERTALALATLEPRVASASSARELAAYDALASQLDGLDERLGGLRRRVTRLAEARLGRELERRGQELVRRPTAEGLADYQRLLERRAELAARLHPAAGRLHGRAGDRAPLRVPVEAARIEPPTAGAAGRGPARVAEDAAAPAHGFAPAGVAADATAPSRAFSPAGVAVRGAAPAAARRAGSGPAAPGADFNAAGAEGPAARAGLRSAARAVPAAELAAQRAGVGSGPLAAQVDAAERRAGVAAERFLERPTVAGLAAAGREHLLLQAARRRAADLGAARELAAARRELRRAGDRLLDAPAESGDAQLSPVRRQRFGAALERAARAEAAFAASLEGRALPLRRGPGDLTPLLGRLAHGDLSPDTLVRTQRALERHLLAAGRPVGPPPPDDPAGPRSLLDALGEARGDRAALRRALRQLAPRLARLSLGGREVLPDLERLRHRLGRYQASAAHLERHALRLGRGPEARILPLRDFLDHPAFAGAAQRATAAWTAHALLAGVPPERVPRLLERLRPARTAAPRLLSGGAGSLACFGVRQLARLARRVARALVAER